MYQVKVKELKLEKSSMLLNVAGNMDLRRALLSVQVPVLYVLFYSRLKHVLGPKLSI